jgi:negative regulator of flagellin synthesis FlgM
VYWEIREVIGMKINDINRAGSINSYRNQSQSGKGIAPHNKGNAKDEVYISEAAKQLLGSQAVDPARAERVADLKNEVSTGTYYVDANKVAEKLLPYLD